MLIVMAILGADALTERSKFTRFARSPENRLGFLHKIRVRQIVVSEYRLDVFELFGIKLVNRRFNFVAIAVVRNETSIQKDRGRVKD